MWRLVALFAILNVVQCNTCPTGFDFVQDGECRGFVTKMTVTFDYATTKAIEKCADVQAQSVIIHDEEQQSYWKSKAPATSDGFLILGLVCDSASKKWQWADGSALDFKPPKTLYNPELDKPCTVGLSWDIHPDGYWSYGGGGGLISAYIYCTVQLPAPVPESCQDGICYQVYCSGENWKGSEEMCKNYGGHLASIHTSKANSFVRQLAVSSGASNGVFIGASTSGSAPFSWSDGSKMDYENYAPGFPRKNFGECVAMDTLLPVGQWMNVDCAAFVPECAACARKESAAPLAPTCSDEEWKEGQVITSPGFPNVATVPCDYFLTVASGKKVETKIILLEANSCCDTLILYDGYIGGSVIAKLTGNVQNATYTTKSSNVMRVSWQPRSGRNVKGVEMTFRGV